MRRSIGTGEIIGFDFFLVGARGADLNFPTANLLLYKKVFESVVLSCVLVAVSLVIPVIRSEVRQVIPSLIDASKMHRLRPLHFTVKTYLKDSLSFSRWPDSAMLGLLTLLSLLSNWRILKCDHFYSQPNADIYTIDITEQHPKNVETALKHCETYSRYAAKSTCAVHTSAAFKEAAEFVDRFYQLRKNNVNDQKFVILDSGCGKGMSTVCLASLYPDIPVIGIDRSITRLSSNKKIEIRSNRNLIDSDKRDLSESGNVEPTFLDTNTELDATSSSEGSIINDWKERGDHGVEENHHSNDNDKDDVSERDVEDDGEERDSEEEISSILLKENAILLRAELSDFFSLVAYQSDWVVHSHYLLYPNPYPKSKHLKRRWHGHPIFPVMLAIGKSHYHYYAM